MRARIEVQSHGNRNVLQEHLHYDGSRTVSQSLVSVQFVDGGILVRLSKELVPRTELFINFLDFYR
jgi:hypothetical protein